MKVHIKYIKMNNNSGQVIVELAIILPFLLLLVFGIAEFGRYLYLKNSATNASREGARKAAVTSPWDSSSVEAYTNALPSMSDFTVTVTPPLGTPPAVSVRVSKKFDSIVPAIIPQLKNYSISAQTTMRYE